MEAAIAPVAENTAIGGDAEELAFHSDGFPGVLGGEEGEGENED